MPSCNSKFRLAAGVGQKNGLTLSSKPILYVLWMYSLPLVIPEVHVRYTLDVTTIGQIQ